MLHSGFTTARREIDAGLADLRRPGGREITLHRRFENVGACRMARNARLPCLATRRPAPAATKAVAVETLSVAAVAAGSQVSSSGLSD